jgi:DNA-binding NtrC family response regulator
MLNASSVDSDFDRFAELVAASGHPVLLTGETGSGKTYLARTIHKKGRRARSPFVRVNCAAIPDSLFEREVFGHVRGAYTDAREAAEGFLAAADGGTLFLDEISELSMSNQPKLLAVLEEGRYRSLGSPKERRVDVQVIAAANRDLTELVRTRHFREDLYYRISVFRFRVPSLRERADQIPGLARDLLRKAQPNEHAPEIASEALDLLQAYPWPGNIRELENVLRAASVYAQGREIEPEHLPEEIVSWVGTGRHTRSPSDRIAAGSTGSAGEARERYCTPESPEEEALLISSVLARAQGNRSRAARMLGMARSTLWVKLQLYGIRAEDVTTDRVRPLHRADAGRRETTRVGR